MLYWHSTHNAHTQLTHPTHTHIRQDSACNGICVMWLIALGTKRTSPWFVSFRSRQVWNINLKMSLRPRRARDIFLPFTQSYRIFIAKMKKGHFDRILCRRCCVNECFGFLFHHYYHRRHHSMLLLLLLLTLFVSLSNYPSFRNIFAAVHIFVVCLFVCRKWIVSACVSVSVDQPNACGAIFIFGNASSETVTLFHIYTVLK